jgi:uncharacterized membrane protein YfcA
VPAVSPGSRPSSEPGSRRLSAVHLSGLDYLAAAGAAAAAGAVNALAGGGTLISFPTLVGIGVPSVAANITNTVSLVPGYLSGSWAQRDDLRPQAKRARPLLAVAALGGLAGSILLVSIPAHAFRVAVPFLILASCLLLLFQDRMRERLQPLAPDKGGGPGPAAAEQGRWRPGLLATVFAGAVYGGFFGAGLGIILLAVLGLFSSEPLAKVNALKQALSFAINLVAAAFFVFSGRVVWELVPVMAAASILGGTGGGRLVRVVNAVILRRLVVLAGVAVAVTFWVA